MRTLLGFLGAVLAMLAAVSPALAQDYVSVDPASVIVCPASGVASTPPAFDAPDCEATARIDPQGREIWVAARLEAPPALVESGEPLGVYVLGKASSEIYLNGRLIGQNGIPGATRAEETPGRMDAVVFAPRDLVRAGDNELVLRMSAHHGFLHLAQPIHALLLGRYGEPQHFNLGGRWPSLITFGAMLAGACYFAAMAALGEGETRRASALLALMAALAAGQLFAEASRALFAYPYPVHDVRLVAIAALSAGFGLALAAHIIWTFAERRRPALWSAVAGLTGVAVALPQGFDWKALAGVLAPTLACAAATAVWTVRRKPRAAWHLAALVVFAGVIVVARSRFLDVYFFYAVAAFLLFLFVQQAHALAGERRLSRREAERASRLELVLEQVREAGRPGSLTIGGAGRMEIVPFDQIVYIKGAGDYVEIVLAGGREILHAGSLTALERTLPATFLRVHRSHIVNTAYVRTLERESSGGGRLTLAQGGEVPVSRRIMPKVRNALA